MNINYNIILLFSVLSCGCSCTAPVGVSSDGCPHAIWSLFYNMELASVDQEVLSGTPTNVYITSNATNKIVYDEAVTEVDYTWFNNALCDFPEGKIIVQENLS